jgi:hypothetical protein
MQTDRKLDWSARTVVPEPMDRSGAGLRARRAVDSSVILATIVHLQTPLGGCGLSVHQMSFATRTVRTWRRSHRCSQQD